MICRAPAMRAPWITDMPTPPTPRTATVEAGATFARFSTAPTPVITPQLISAALSSGMSVRIFTRALSWTSIRSAYAPIPAACVRGRPPTLSRGGAPGAPRRLVGAQVGPADEAVVALAAEEGEAGDDMIAGLKL